MHFGWHCSQQAFDIQPRECPLAWEQELLSPAACRRPPAREERLVPCRGGTMQRWTFPAPGEDKLVTCYYGLSPGWWLVPSICPPRPQQHPTSAAAAMAHSSCSGRSSWLCCATRGWKRCKEESGIYGNLSDFSRKRRTRGLQSFCTGFRLQIHAWKSWEMPNTRDLGELCSGLLPAASWGCTAPPTPLVRAELRLEGIIPQLMGAWLPHVLLKLTHPYLLR